MMPHYKLIVYLLLVCYSTTALSWGAGKILRPLRRVATGVLMSQVMICHVQGVVDAVQDTVDDIERLASRDHRLLRKAGLFILRGKMKVIFDKLRAAVQHGDAFAYKTLS